MTVGRVRERQRKVFRSVFQTDPSPPTPLLSPTGEGEAFGVAARPPGSPGLAAELKGGAPAAVSGTPTKHKNDGSREVHRRNPSRHHRANLPPPTHSDSDQQVRWDRAWHTVTSRIQLPASVTVEDSFGTIAPESQDHESDAVFYDALAVVLYPASTVPRAAHTDDVLLWHIHQVRRHFVHHVLPLLGANACQDDRSEVLLTSIQLLEAAYRLYLYGVTLFVRGFRPADAVEAEAAFAKFRHDVHAIIGNAWAEQGLQDALCVVLKRLLRVVLSGSPRVGPGTDDQHARPQAPDSEASAARTDLHNLVGSLQNIGLAGDRFKILFAETMNSSMHAHIRDTYCGAWTTSESSEVASQSLLEACCMDSLSDWVENHYSRIAVEVLSRIGGNVAWRDVERWRSIAIGRLANLRMRELFDIVLHWPHSKGGLDDLRAAVTTPQRRLDLTDTFSAVLQRRLLHPGRSTLDILQTYISIIRTFHALDHSKVLLNRVAQALQLYLCQRDDAIRIVVIGLLSDPKSIDAEGAQGKLVELASILNEDAQNRQQRRQAEDDELDWSDMNWLPDPVDAGVNYKRPKNEDVIGTLISALGSQDIFIREFQLILAERLLSHQAGFQQETRVLGLLKKRFGENALQNCDVMIRDIVESRRIDSDLRAALEPCTRPERSELCYGSKILSRLFWPSMPRDSYNVPTTVAQAQEEYAAGFQVYKSSRKLNWLDQLGSATVRLDLEDRSVEVQCKTYEAALIYAFQPSGPLAAEPQRRTFNELWESLRMDEDLLELALKFWTSQRILRDVGDRTYVVLERLDVEDKLEESEDEPSAAAEEEQAQNQHASRSARVDAQEAQRRVIYWQFIVGMLTNSGPAMPLGQIAMMMRMLISDGYPWSNEELLDFLGEKVAAGALEFSGGKYRLPKK